VINIIGKKGLVGPNGINFYKEWLKQGNKGSVDDFIDWLMRSEK
jgi:hypothetical protein